MISDREQEEVINDREQEEVINDREQEEVINDREQDRLVVEGRSIFAARSMVVGELKLSSRLLYIYMLLLSVTRWR